MINNNIDYDNHCNENNDDNPCNENNDDKTNK